MGKKLFITAVDFVILSVDFGYKVHANTRF